MRYQVCEFCRKNNKTGVCYDDCCIGGNRFEPRLHDRNEGKTMDDKLIIIQYPIFTPGEAIENIHKSIVAQRDTGVILIPDFCKIFMAPKGIEIRLREEKV